MVKLNADKFSSAADAALFVMPPLADLPALDLARARAAWAACCAGAGAAAGDAEAAVAQLEADREAAAAAALFAAFTLLRAAVRSQLAELTEAGELAPPRLEAVVRFLTRGALNLRSALSRHAVVAAGELAAAARGRLCSLQATDGLVAALLLRVCSDKKFIRCEAEAALRGLASVEPSSADLFFSFLRHSHSKSRPLSIASATLADTCLAHVPAAELEALDLCAAASLAKAFVASKSAEARGAAAAISRHLAEARGFEAWSAAVASVTKPIEFRDLMAGCRAAPGPTAAPSSVIEEVSPFAAALAAVAAAEAGSVETAAFSGGRGACRSGGEAAAEPVIALSSPGCCVSGGGIGDAAALLALAGCSPAGVALRLHGQGHNVPSLAAYLRERSSQRRRRSALTAPPSALRPLGPLSPLGAGALPLLPFSPVLSSSVSRRSAGERELRRMSSSPVLVLKRGGEHAAAPEGTIAESADENAPE